VCLLLGTGCNKGSSAGKGIVAGKVTLGGKGVGPDATVAFFSSDGKQIAEAPTTDTGDYLMPEVPMGSVKIAVLRRTPIQGAAMVKMDPSMPGASSSAALSIPPKYSKPDNGLTYTVTQGQQRHDIELTP